MNISWTSRSPFNSTIVDDASGQVIFAIQAHLNTKPQVITMSDAQGKVIGVYESQLGRHDRITYKGQTHKLSDWLTKKHWYSTFRQLHAPNGRTYMWKENFSVSGRLKLVDEQADTIVAESHVENMGVNAPKHNVQINASLELVPFLDLVVLSFIICEYERRARNQQGVVAD